MRPRWGGAYPVSILSVCLWLEAAQPGARRRPELTVPVCSQPAPTLDGRLDDACWDEAEPVVHFYVTGDGELGAGHRVTLVQRDGWSSLVFAGHKTPIGFALGCRNT